MTSQESRIDDICDRFESGWGQDPRPHIEGLLAEVQPAHRPRLFRDLLRVEHELRCRAGEAPTLEEYLARFPDLADEVVSVFAEHGAPAGPVVRYFGDYELLGEIGRGGMGVVYKAWQRSLNRLVALKMIRSGHLADESEVRRFKAEAEAAANLAHPQIVPIYEIGEHGGQHYFTMKLVEGANLGKRPPEEAARLMILVARAVHHAHQRGVLHLDLKPPNVLIDADGQPHVVDFGLARRSEGRGELTRSGVIEGTPGFMSPEQAAGQRRAITTSTDVYGLGATLYAALTGREPFRGDTFQATLEQVRGRSPERPSTLNHLVDRDLETITLKCLEKGARQRYVSAEALAEDLGRWLAGEPIRARPVPAWERAIKWVQRQPIIAALIGAIVVVAVAGLVVGVTQWQAAVYNAEQSKKNEEKANLKSALAEKAGLAAMRQERRSRAAMLSERARLSIDVHAAESLRTAIAAVETTMFAGEGWTRESEQVLRDALSRIGGIPSAAHDGIVEIEGISQNGRGLITTSYPSFPLFAGADNKLRYWRRGGEGLFDSKMAITPPQGSSFLALGEDYSEVLALSTSGGVQRWDLSLPQSNRAPRILLPGGQLAAPAAASSDGHWLISGDTLHNLRDPSSERVTLGRSLDAVAIDADGRHVAGLTADHAVLLWTLSPGLKTQAEPESLLSIGPKDRVGQLMFSADGNLLVLTQLSGAVHLWDLSPGSRRHIALQNTVPITIARVSRDNRWLLGASYYDGYPAANLWNISDLNRVTTASELKGHQQPILCAAFSNDGRRAVTGSYDGTLRVWDLTQGSLGLDNPIVMRGHDAAVVSVIATPGDGWILSGSLDGTIRQWDLGRATRIAKLSNTHELGVGVKIAGTVHAVRDDLSITKAVGEQQAVGLAMSADNRWLTLNGLNQPARMLDLNRADPTSGEREIPTRNKDTREVFMSVSPDSRWLAVGEHRGEGPRIWRLGPDGLSQQFAGVALLQALSRNESIVGMTFSRDSKWFATDGAKTRLWNLAVDDPSRIQKRVLHENEEDLHRLAFSPDGSLLARLGGARLSLFPTDAAHSTIDFDGVQEFAFTANGHWLIMQRGKDLALLAARKITVGSKPIVLSGCEMLLSDALAKPDQHGLILRSDGKDLFLVDLLDDDPGDRGRWKAIREPGDPIRIGPSGKWLVLERHLPEGGGSEFALLDLDKQPGNGLARVIQRPIEFSPDGRWLVTSAGHDIFTKFGRALIDLASIDASKTILLEAGFGSEVAVSPDSKWLATVDEHLRLWDLKHDKPIESMIILSKTKGQVAQIYFTNDCRWMVFVSGSDASLWNLRMNELLREARGTAGRKALREDVAPISPIQLVR